MDNKEFQCPICAKYFSRKFTLDAHMLIHKGVKPYLCQFCGKYFRQKGTLMRHKALHSSKNLFHCSLCNHGFRQKNVFIFHLRHRHNVSTETLDRRKYRPELKDYQSIMNTLPPFVHADSAAIASSGEHFDAILNESIQNPVNSTEIMQCDFSVENNLQATHSNSSSFNIESTSQIDHINTGSSELNNLNSPNYKEVNEDYSVDIKPFLHCNSNEMCAIEYPSKNSNVNSSENSLYSHISNVMNSVDTNSEIITCIPCQLNFNSESEFKNHMKIHVQSVLSVDVDINDNISSVESDGSQASNDLPESTSSSRNKSFNTPEIINAFGSSNVTFSSLPKKKLLKNQQKWVCPICNVCLYGETALKEHSKNHDSYSLMKLISKPLGNKSDSSNHQKQLPLRNHTCSGSSSHKQFANNKKVQQKVQNISSCFKNSFVKTKNLSKMNKSKLVCMQCDKMFANKLLLEYHRQLHLSTKGFSCRCCKKSFSSKKLLLSHTHLHHMKSFTCLKCFKSFNYHRLFDSHRKQCTENNYTGTLNGIDINFPVVSIESLLKSSMKGIIGIIPVSSETGEESGLKNGIPVMSVSQIKALYKS